MNDQRPTPSDVWVCVICRELIRVNTSAPLGGDRYEHVDPVILSSHFAVRGAD